MNAPDKTMSSNFSFAGNRLPNPSSTPDAASVCGLSRGPSGILASSRRTASATPVKFLSLGIPAEIENHEPAK